MPKVKAPENLQSLKDATFPMSPALKFLRQVEELETQPKRRRFLLLEKHNEVFSVYPGAGTPLEVVRARVAYRLQFEGHRLTNTKPSEKFMQNYRAIMAFNEKEPFKGCTRNVAIIGTLYALDKGEVSMSAVKKVKTAVKKLARATAKANKPSAKKREMVLGELSVTETIRYMAKVLDAGAKQIDAALKKLGVHSMPSTIQAQRHRALKGLLEIPRLTTEQIAKIKAAVPPPEKVEKKAVSKLKPVKKLTPKLKKLKPVSK
jgi:hypothetical protein